ncbi:hypothetical protein KP509_28G058800 [Ceratopteris richardii]|uniref:Metallothionein-like protein n=1 Tax=Ceratopteris richardii TaxID=49495 RepID=A0A8T2RCI0_CERRI|nr:hypothetical protein KP509_28G058800 [Ceratopteris richardii]
MSSCGNANCSCGSSCSCGSGCRCGKRIMDIESSIYEETMPELAMGVERTGGTMVFHAVSTIMHGSDCRGLLVLLC